MTRLDRLGRPEQEQNREPDTRTAMQFLREGFMPPSEIIRFFQEDWSIESATEIVAEAKRRLGRS